MTEPQRHYGKFRGVVINNVDPMQMGRIQVQVPDVLGLGVSSWAMPCVPFAGQQSGVFVVPQVGAGVWVEFEQGKPDYPIWVGGFWGSAAEVPALALAGLPVSPSIVLQTGGQNTLMISDLPGPTGGILLKTKTGAMISISDVGITLSNGQGATVMLAGPAVNINQGALTVT
ncbi:MULTISPECIES: phage baseplate assembly protein V [Achromobacter]|uniref:phage baseplate assembly protein V n=1 Tax=Achromobacter TaxID=222 RepID=UPI00244A7B1B|nr:phage baseplate assembly protein V [Achromobacter animicus]MDH0681032.1 phage baseplate assembly protein V [Achromobacter animicus]